MSLVRLQIFLSTGFYDEVWFKDNAGLSPAKLVSHRIERLMCYHVLTQRGTIISKSSVQRVTELEKATAFVKDTFSKFDKAIHSKLKCIDRGYAGDKSNSEDWEDLPEDDEDFRDEFQNTYNNVDIHEAEDYTPEVIEDTNLNMEIALPRDS